MKIIIAALFLALVATPADASVSCALVHWAIAHLSRETLNAYIAAATPEQIKEGRACLAAPQHQQQHKKKKHHDRASPK
jgi:hypothetical protein